MRAMSLRVVIWLVLAAHLFGQEMPCPKVLTVPEFRPTQTYFLSKVTVLHRLEPEYTQEARKVRRQGTVVLYVEVGPLGLAERIRVIRGLGLGLDEKAIEAVQQWLFKPVRIYGPQDVVTTLVPVEFRLPEAPETSSDDLLVASSETGISADGQLQNIQVLQGLGSGLDELAVERIGLWKFEPAMREGKPVRVMMPIEINFSLGRQ